MIGIRKGGEVHDDENFGSYDAVYIRGTLIVHYRSALWEHAAPLREGETLAGRRIERLIRVQGDANWSAIREGLGKIIDMPPEHFEAWLTAARIRGEI